MQSGSNAGGHFDFLPTLPVGICTCNAICGTMAGAQQIETEPSLNDFLVRILN